MSPIAINEVNIEARVSLTPQVSHYQMMVHDQRRSLENLVPFKRRGTTSTLSQLNHRTAASELLAELARLGPNWDGYGAEPIDTAIVLHVRAILAALPSRIPSPEITPNPNGTLTLDWETEEQALSLELGATRFSSFWECRRVTRTKAGIVTTGIPDFVALALDSLFPAPACTPATTAELMIDAEGPSGFITPCCHG